MAERVAGKAKKRAQKAPAQSATAPVAKGMTQGTGSTGQAGRRDDLEGECARLADELNEARARIKALEEQRELLINRIDWVIDSLHSLTDE